MIDTFEIPREEVAYHEAGHLIVADAVGLRFTAATILRRSATEFGSVAAEIPDEITDPVARAMAVATTHCAGLMAQRRFNNGCDTAGARGDGTKAKEALTKTFPADEFDARLDQAATAAHAIVRDEWPAVEVVARALLQHETICGEPLRALVHGARGRT